MHFKSRHHAGELLADLLKDVDSEVVVALPNGGVPVASKVEKALNLPLELLTVRKLGLPKSQEYAFGVLSSNDVVVLDEYALKSYNVSQELINKVVQEKQVELKETEEKIRKFLPKVHLEGKKVILIDDGMTTGTTIHAAIESLKIHGVEEIVVAVPVAGADAIKKIEKKGHKVYCLNTEQYLKAVGFWYEDFSQVTDEDVMNIVKSTKK
ncbi:MAG TPA: phosphoribosyl transferase [Legionellales bacterium]|nr:phosphoribosyl transferase [Legionellales bacterium]